MWVLPGPRAFPPHTHYRCAPLDAAQSMCGRLPAVGRGPECFGLVSATPCLHQARCTVNCHCAVCIVLTRAARGKVQRPLRVLACRGGVPSAGHPLGVCDLLVSSVAFGVRWRYAAPVLDGSSGHCALGRTHLAKGERRLCPLLGSSAPGLRRGLPRLRCRGTRSSWVESRLPFDTDPIARGVPTTLPP